MPESTSYKVLVLGSGGVGKSEFTVCFVQGIFVEKYDATIEDSYFKPVEYDGRQYLLEILDTAGTEQFTAMRDLYMKNCHGAILIYSIIAQSTFNDIPDLYEQILRVKDQDSVPSVLVGNKCHLFDQRVIRTDQGELMAKKLGIGCFLEASASANINVAQTFYELIRQMDATYRNQTKQKSSKGFRFPSNLLRGLGSSGELTTDIAELFEAVKLQDHNTLRKYFESKTAKKISSLYYKGMNILSYACSCGNMETIALLQEISTEKNILCQSDKTGKTLIQYCAENSKKDNLFYLIDEGVPLECAGKCHLLAWCFENEKYDVIIWLLSKENVEIDSDEVKKRMINAASKTNPVRITLLGAPAAGKTTLVELCNRVIEKQNEFPSNNLATDGIAVRTLEFKTKAYSFWDFGGQETLYATHQFFLSEECQFMIVVNLFALTSENEKERQECERNTKYWLHLARDWTISHTTSPVILVGTHCDSFPSSKKKSTFTDFAVKKLLSLATEENLRVHEQVHLISKTSNILRTVTNLWATIEELTRKFILPRRGLVDGCENKLNIRQAALRLLIDREKKANQFIWWNRFKKLCEQVGITGDEEITAAAKFLVNFGSILTYRHQSTGGASIVVLDPEWLAKALTSIVSITFQSSKLRRGIFTKQTLQNNWKKLNLDSETTPQILRLFELFQLIVELPTGDYFVPAMLHAQRSSHGFSKEEKKVYLRNIVGASDSVECFGRIIRFSSLPFGLVERLVVRMLHFPDMTIDSKYTCANDYLITSPLYTIRIQTNFEDNLIKLSLYSCTRSIHLSFLCHFLFESPQSLLSSYSSLNANIIDVKVLYNKQEFASEQSVISKTLQGENMSKQAPDLGLEGIPLLSGNALIHKKLASGTFGIARLGSIDGEEVVFKELLNSGESLEHQKEFLREVLMMKVLACEYLVELKGIFKSVKSLVESSACHGTMKLDSLLMVMEFASHGDLSNCRKSLVSASKSLKCKIGLDIARGLRQLHGATGLPLMHRDVRSQNIFVFSLDESKSGDKRFVHAKLGDFGTVVVASPNYGENLGNWQYMAPEAFRGALTVPYSPKIDIYSFGIVLWEIFANEIPFSKYLGPGRAEEGKQNILEGERLPIPHDLPKSLKELIQSCWESDPGQRPEFSYIVERLDEIHHYFVSNHF